jgi:CheY-like chemotaxis protein
VCPHVSSHERTRKTMPCATILYAEDHAAVRLALKETLEHEGWGVDACADGLAALAKLEGEARYDLLLFDNDMPGVDGLELARRARVLAHRRDTPVVITSASEVRAEARRAGADAFLRKPEDMRDVARTLASLLKRTREVRAAER